MKKAIKFIIVIISLLILFILILKQIELRDYKGKGDVMLEKISNYKELNGELPNNSTDFFYSNESALCHDHNIRFCFTSSS